jgi:hypothetical protein
MAAARQKAPQTSVRIQGVRAFSVVIPGRREAAGPESIRRSAGDMDSGLAAHSASKTRVNALVRPRPGMTSAYFFFIG